MRFGHLPAPLPGRRLYSCPVIATRNAGTHTKIHTLLLTYFELLPTQQIRYYYLYRCTSVAYFTHTRRGHAEGRGTTFNVVMTGRESDRRGTPSKPSCRRTAASSSSLPQSTCSACNQDPTRTRINAHYRLRHTTDQRRRPLAHAAPRGGHVHIPRRKIPAPRPRANHGTICGSSSPQGRRPAPRGSPA